jgi:hypothetical protein
MIIFSLKFKMSENGRYCSKTNDEWAIFLDELSLFDFLMQYSWE